MAKQIDIWDAEKSEQVPSRDEYVSYWTTMTRAHESSWDNDEAVAVRLFVNTRTGVVCVDVAKYEASLGVSA